MSVKSLYQDYLRKQPTAGKISFLMNSGKAHVRVAKDNRVKY